MVAKEWFQIVAVTAALTVFSAHGELYKWVDANGQTHYSDVAPAEGAQDSLVEYQAPADNRMLAPSQNAFPKRRVKDKRRTKKNNKKAKSKPQNCEKYQTQLTTLQKKLRAGYREPQGNKLRARRRVLADKLKQCRKG